MKVFIIASFIAVCSCARLDSNYLPPASAPSAGGGPGLAAPGFGRPGGSGFGGQQSGFGVGGQQSGFSSGGSSSQQGGYGGGAQQGAFSSAGSSSQQGGYGGGAQQGGFASAGSASQGGYGGAPSGPQQPPIAILSYENVNNGDGSYKFSYETANGIKAQEQGDLKNKGSENAIQTVSGSYSYTAPDGQLITITYVADENGFQPQGDHLPTPPPIPQEIAESLKVIAAAQAQGNQGYQTGSYNEQSNSGYPGAPSSNNNYPSAPVNSGYPSGPAPGGRPGNQYVPPPNQPRPTGNGGFNPQSGYKY